MDCDAIRDLIPVYPLGALSRDEILTVNRHVERCAACAAAITEYEGVAAMMAHLAAPKNPPLEAKAALFARVAQSDTAHRAAGRVTAVAPERATGWTAVLDPGSTATIPASRPGVTDPASTPPVRASRFGRLDPRASWSTPRSWRSYTVPVATTAIPLVLALALVGGWAYSLRDDAASARDDQNFMGTFSSVLSSGDGNLYQMVAAAEVPEAEGQFLASPDGNDGILMVSGLEPERSDGNYEVWIEQDGRTFKYATLQVDRQGNGQMLIEVVGSFKLCRGVYIQEAPVNGDTGGANVLWTSLTTPGPANGGKQTEGDPEIGSSVATVQLASK